MAAAQDTTNATEANFYSFWQIEDDSWIAFSRATEHMPIVKVKASIDTPCIDPMSIRSYGPSQYSYRETGSINRFQFKVSAWDCSGCEGKGNNRDCSKQSHRQLYGGDGGEV